MVILPWCWWIGEVVGEKRGLVYATLRDGPHYWSLQFSIRQREPVHFKFMLLLSQQIAKQAACEPILNYSASRTRIGYLTVYSVFAVGVTQKCLAQWMSNSN